MTQGLGVTRAVHDAIVAHAIDCAPLEACGLLGAAGDLVVAFEPVENAAHSPTRFELDGGGMLAAERTIEDRGAEVMGVMHSHPTSPAWPSDTDVRDAAVYDPAGVFVHVIVSLADSTPDVRAFRLVGERRVPCALFVQGGQR